MKKKLLTAALAFLAGAFVATSQAAPVTANYGDILLGFEVTDGSGTQNLLIDLGSYTTIGSFTNINIASDLATVFGSGWSNSVSYGAYGTTIAGGHWGQNYLTTTNPVVGLLAKGNTSSKIDATALVDYYNLQRVNSSTTTNGVYGSSSATGAWSTFLPSTSPFGVSADPGIETTLGTSLSLWNRTYSPNTVAITPYTLLVDSAGNLSVSAVPEPSTYLLFGLGALALVLRVRRRLTNV